MLPFVENDKEKTKGSVLMATSTCPKCNSTRFEVKENSPSGSNYRLAFVQCSSCGCVVGVLDFVNIGDLGNKILKRLS
jgi:ssDNA-binding Zn-finger/Zn-ribbon topoisomerase 1